MMPCSDELPEAVTAFLQIFDALQEKNALRQTGRLYSSPLYQQKDARFSQQ